MVSSWVCCYSREEGRPSYPSTSQKEVMLAVFQLRFPLNRRHVGRFVIEGVPPIFPHLALCLLKVMHQGKGMTYVAMTYLFIGSNVGVDVVL